MLEDKLEKLRRAISNRSIGGFEVYERVPIGNIPPIREKDLSLEAEVIVSKIKREIESKELNDLVKALLETKNENLLLDIFRAQKRPA